MRHDAARQNAECRNKLALLTEAQAAEQAALIREHKGYVGRPYECGWCGYWHIGQLGKHRRARTM